MTRHADALLAAVRAEADRVRAHLDRLEEQEARLARLADPAACNREFINAAVRATRRKELDRDGCTAAEAWARRLDDPSSIRAVTATEADGFAERIIQLRHQAGGRGSRIAGPPGLYVTIAGEPWGMPYPSEAAAESEMGNLRTAVARFMAPPP